MSSGEQAPETKVSEKDTEKQEKSRGRYSKRGKVIVSVFVLFVFAGVFVVALFTIPIGDDRYYREAQAGINFVINEDREVINISLTTMGNADYVVLKNVSGMEVSGSIEGTVGPDGMIYLRGVTSEPIRLSPGSNISSGEIDAVAVISEPTEKFAVGNPQDEVAIVVKREPQNSFLIPENEVPTPLYEKFGDRMTRTTIQTKEYDFR